MACICRASLKQPFTYVLKHLLHCHEVAQLLLYGMTGTNSSDAHQGQANVEGMDDTDDEDNNDPDDDDSVCGSSDVTWGASDIETLAPEFWAENFHSDSTDGNDSEPFYDL